jgi:hypothetical protein
LQKIPRVEKFAVQKRRRVQILWVDDMIQLFQ